MLHPITPIYDTQDHTRSLSTYLVLLSPEFGNEVAANAFMACGRLNRLRKNLGRDRKDVPQGLKPNVFSIHYGPTKVVP